VAAPKRRRRRLSLTGLVLAGLYVVGAGALLGCAAARCDPRDQHGWGIAAPVLPAALAAHVLGFDSAAVATAIFRTAPGFFGSVILTIAALYGIGWTIGSAVRASVRAVARTLKAR
jgi:hypothetical protein